MVTHITTQPGYAPGNLETRKWRPRNENPNLKSRTIGHAWSPYTLHPATYILPPTPYTLRPTP